MVVQDSSLSFYDFLMHQIQTSSVLISGCFELFEKDPTDENQAELGEEIAHLKKLLSEASLFRDLMHPSLDLELSQIDFHSFLEDVSRSFSLASREKEFDFYPPAKDRSFSPLANEFYLKELLRIFLDNACKYTPEEGTISWGVKQNDERNILFVRNTGIGIPDGYQEKIFDPFFRINRNQHGSGLGLSIAQKIAALLEIDISLDSDGSHYVEFLLTFPSS